MGSREGGRHTSKRRKKQKKGSRRRWRNRGEEGKVISRCLDGGIEAEVIGEELKVEKKGEVRVRKGIKLEGRRRKNAQTDKLTQKPQREY